MDGVLPAHLKTAFSLGLVSREEVIALADQALVTTEYPPQWLLDLSGAPIELPPYDFLKLLAGDEVTTDEEFLGLCAYGQLHGVLDSRKIGHLLYDRFCDAPPGKMTFLRQQIYVYDDELDWDVDRAMTTLQSILAPFAAKGETLISKLKA